jgi:hypothetical protein
MCEETAQLGKVYTTSLCFSNEQSARGKPYSTGAALLAGLNEAEPRFPETQTLLRELVRKWDECGQNLQKMLNKTPRFAPIIQRDWKAQLSFAKDGAPSLSITPVPAGPNLSRDANFALYLFMNLMIDRCWQKLGGPCHADQSRWQIRGVRQ